jgi:ribonucleoside-diphosphate reductase beta chain
MLGMSNGESEVRHSEAYSELLTVLGLEESFNNLLEVPVMKERVEYLSKALTLKTDKKQDYVLSLILFSILIENVSLFSQFAIMLSFTRFKGIMMSISNVIAYTAFEEQIHGKSGVYIINIIRKEYPELFTDNLYDKVRELIEHSISVESRMLDWIFEEGEIDSVSKKDLLFFMKDRVDVNLTSIGMDKMYNVSTEDLKPMFWFNEEVTADTLDDFFAKKPVDYSKHDKPISANDLF